MNIDNDRDAVNEDEGVEKEPYVTPTVESIGLSDDAADSLT